MKTSSKGGKTSSDIDSGRRGCSARGRYCSYSVLAREQEESERSSSEASGSSSEGSVLPGMQGIFLKQVPRDLESATAMKGGVKQDRKPSWSFTGRLSIPAWTE